MAMREDQHEASSLWKTLMDALKLLTKNMKLTVPIFILAFSSCSFLFLIQNTSTTPILKDLIPNLIFILQKLTKDKGPLGPLGPDFFDHLTSLWQEMKQLIVIQAGFNLASFFVSLLLSIAAIYTFAMAYSNKPLSSKELLKRIEKRWYETLTTCLYIVILSLGFGVLSVSIIGITMLASDGSKLSLLYISCPAFIAVSLYIYLLTRWYLSLVITVAEEAYGIGALSEAVVLYIGNAKKGCVITTLVLGVEIVIGAAFGYVMRSGSSSMKMAAQMEVVLAFLAVNLAWYLFAMALYTVFYYECRKSNGIYSMGREASFIYTSIVTDSKV